MEHLGSLIVVMRFDMLIRESIASILAAALFFAPVSLAFLFPMEADPNDSWQRGVVVAPFIFVIAVPIIWAAGRYLLSKGLRTPLRFSVGAFVLTGGLVAALITPAIVIGINVELFSWSSAALGGLAVLLCASVASLPASLAWWWIAAHNKSFNWDALKRAR